MQFSNTYTSLGEAFYENAHPTPVKEPKIFLWNDSLAEQLQVSQELIEDKATLAKVFAGNHILAGSQPIALAYAGHQFGQFVPQLGDGRAHLLGEVIDQSDKRWDVQLKGSGETMFSRGGDGRCALGPAVREFLMSEAMHALGVPTTRSLAVVTTGEQIYRQTIHPGAIVTRVAASHLRVGTFQYFAARRNLQALKILSDYAIERHFPELQDEGPKQYLNLIDKVIEKQIELIVHWMRVGFIHGVMNTDNTAISGETIDYGPCAMMGIYDPETVFSSIDYMGRYAFGNQPEIAQWNLVRFVETILPLIDEDHNQAIEMIGPLLTGFSSKFKEAYKTMMGKKLGIFSFQQRDEEILVQISEKLVTNKLDYTITFNQLTETVTGNEPPNQLKEDLGDAFLLWKNRINNQSESPAAAQSLMRQNNPLVIPRNHHVEKVLQECESTGSPQSAEKFLEVIRSPYQETEQISVYQDAPIDGDANYKTFCGT